jgi:outer membrane immunogenic protein
MLVALPAHAQQASSGALNVLPAIPTGTSPVYAWSGLNTNNSYIGGFVGGIFALNGNLNSEGWLFRAEGAGGNYDWNTATLPSTRIETYNGALMLGYKKQIGQGWLSVYGGGAFETHNNPDVPAPTTLQGTKGGAKGLIEYWGPLGPKWEVYSSFSYATPFSVTNAYGRVGYKWNDKVTIGPETGYFGNDAYRDWRAGGFISFKTSFGEIAFSGGYRDPFTPGPAGYYANVFFGFERWPPGPAPSTSGLPVKAASVTPVYNWSGFYVGGQAGYGWDNIEFSNPTLGDAFRSKTAGFAGGGQIGYNWQVNQWVFGVEANLLGTDLRNSLPSSVGLVTTPYVDRVDWVGTVVGRLGYAINRSLFYVDGGWATARVAISGPNNIIGDTFSTRGTEDGWTVGGGWEYALENNWIVGLDYKRIELGRTTRSGLSNLALPFTITNIDPKIDLVTVRLSYKFGDLAKGPVVAKY